MADKVLVNESDTMYTMRTFEWNDQTVEVRQFLPFKEALAFVNDVVDGCFDESGTFIPEALDFLKRYELIKQYTNITMPNDTATIYAILYGTELYDDILEFVNLDQLDALHVTISKRIEMITNDQKEKLESKISELYSTLSNFANTIQEVFGDTTGEQFAEFISAIANGDVNAEKIVSSLLKAKREEIANDTDGHKEAELS